MKHVTLNQLIIAVVVIAFTTFAVIHVIHLTQAGLINWRN